MMRDLVIGPGEKEEEKESFLYRMFKRVGWRAIGTETSTEDREELLERVKGTPELERATAKAQEQQASLLSASYELAKLNAQFEHKAVDGLGVKVASIPMELFVQTETIHGHGCFRDPAFMKSFLHKNPQFAIATTRGTRGQQYIIPRGRDRMRP